MKSLKQKRHLHDDWEEWDTDREPSIKPANTCSNTTTPDPNSIPTAVPKETQTQARLAGELIKLASTYKVPELTFVKKAAWCCLNYQGWIARLRPILAMFTETAPVLDKEHVIHFTSADCIENKALFLLISSRVDDYFQRAIRGFEGKGDKALQFIKTKCANIMADDTHHFHHLFTSICIKKNESATSYFRHFTFGCTEAEGAGNSYTGEALVNLP